jgi:hypothetical protein
LAVDTTIFVFTRTRKWDNDFGKTKSRDEWLAKINEIDNVEGRYGKEGGKGNMFLFYYISFYESKLLMELCSK